MSDLRQRRREETERLLQETALQLAMDQGIEAVTIEALCAAAGISQRTFFNYFPFKEAVFAVAPPPFGEEALEAFVAGEGSLLDDLTDLILGQVFSRPLDRRLLQVLEAARESQPRLAAIQVAKFHEFDAELASHIARRLSRPAGDLDCAVLAGAVTSTIRVVVDAWSKTDEPDIAPTLRQGLAALRLFERDPS